MRNIYFEKDICFGWHHSFYDLQVVIEVQAEIFVQHNAEVPVLIILFDETPHKFVVQYLRGRFFHCCRLLLS